MSFIKSPQGYVAEGRQPWVLTPGGVLIPARQLLRRTRLAHADVVLKYWKVQLSAADLLGSTEGLGRARQLLTRHAIASTMEILSKAALILAQTPYQQMMDAQRYLAQQFFPRELLDRADAWIRAKRPEDGEVYLFGEQQLLLAMCLTLLAHKGSGLPLPRGAPFAVLGEALLHTTYELDPLETADARAAIGEPEVRRRLYAEFALRKGIFYGHDDYRYAIARYYDLFCDLAPTLGSDPDFVDVPATFKRATGLSVETYLAMGIGLLTPLHQINRDNAHETPALLDRRRLFATSNVRRAAHRFFKVVATDKGRFRRAMRLDLQRHGNVSYNFLEAERHPLVEIRKNRLCCVNFHFLERKFSSGMHHIVLDALPEAQRLRYFAFFGKVFERYVQRICEQAFTSDRFVRGFKYGHDQREAADGWIIYPDSAIVIEAKSARFTLDTRLSGRLGSFERTFRDSILRGAQQLNRVIDDFRAGAFTVAGQGPTQLRVLYPTLVTLEYVPLEHFLADYVRKLLGAAGLLQQPGVRPLVLLPIKEVEQIEGVISTGANFALLLQEYVDHPQWREWPFSNFRFNRFPEGIPMNTVVLKRIRGLIARAGYQLFGARLD